MNGMRRQIDAIQVLRFVAASAVVLSHAISRTDRTFGGLEEESLLFAWEPTRTWGHAGVDLFFIISGFIMVWTTWNEPRGLPTTLSFLRRRLARVVPIYWLASALAVAVLAIAPSLTVHGQRLDVSWIVHSFLFIPTVSPGGEIFSPVIGLGWTLNFEMYFYLLFGLLLALPFRRALTVLTLFFGASVTAGFAFHLRGPAMAQMTSWLTLEFVVGCWIAWFQRERAPMPRFFRSLTLAAGILGLAISLLVEPTQGGIGASHPMGYHFVRFIWWGLPNALVVLALTSAPGESRAGPLFRRLAELGDASYSIYLFQIFLLPVAAQLLRWVGAQHALPFDALVLMVTSMAVAGGVVIHRTVEQPLATAVHRWLGSESRRRQSQTR